MCRFSSLNTLTRVSGVEWRGIHKRLRTDGSWYFLHLDRLLVIISFTVFFTFCSIITVVLRDKLGFSSGLSVLLKRRLLNRNFILASFLKFEMLTAVKFRGDWFQYQLSVIYNRMFNADWVISMSGDTVELLESFCCHLALLTYIVLKWLLMI